ncbi:cuticle protein [Holotrichia oblita]|uniref:Cuticle protein n=1 Tax=Holotrichia oblita TaxID=644536 RepID=A0ACB9SSR2_HOLOL|nr:cuticle protein [Holotrichia oblita]
MLFYLQCSLLALIGLVSAQYNSNDPRNVAILKEQRYLSGDGTFGATYSQEDGVQFKEESDAAGNRVGTYSYVDPNGQRRTVSYTAGKHGFQATGDGIPEAPPTQLPVAPQPLYKPLPQYNSPDYQEPQYRPQPQYESQQQPQYQPPPQQQYQSQPQYQPPQQQYQAPQQQYQPPQQQYQPPQQQYQPQAQYQPPQQPSYTTTPAPHRFYPPGKLSLNRSPDGFSYSFQKS